MAGFIDVIDVDDELDEVDEVEREGEDDERDGELNRDDVDDESELLKPFVGCLSGADGIWCCLPFRRAGVGIGKWPFFSARDDDEEEDRDDLN